MRNIELMFMEFAHEYLLYDFQLSKNITIKLNQVISNLIKSCWDHIGTFVLNIRDNIFIC